MKLLVKTLNGIESLLKNELEQLGATNVETQRKAVTAEADKETLYKICYRSRFATRVNIVVLDFETVDEDDVYDKVREFQWHEYIKSGSAIYIDHVSFADNLPNSQAVARKTADAIIDEIGEATRERVFVSTTEPDLIVNVHITDYNTTVSIDAVGLPLDRRGYRDNGISAATNEVLAAALVELSGWTPDQALVDPMCGAGTICIEAAMKARNIPAAFFRKYTFCFEALKDFDSALWQHVKEEANALRNNIRLTITGSDIDTDATDLAKTSTLEMKLSTDVRISRKGLREQTRMTQEGVIITCPPTNPDQTRRGLPDFYKEATHYMSHNFPDYDVWIYSTDAEAMDAIPFDAQEELETLDGYFYCYPF